jgi:hypothetical protein
MKDLFHSLHPVAAIAPVSVSDNTPLVSAVIDRQGYDSASFVILTGALADADATFAALLEESDNGTDFTAVDAAALLGTAALAGFTFADDSRTRKLGYGGSKRYLRLTVTPSSNSSAALIAAVALLGHPAVAPTANPPA